MYQEKIQFTIDPDIDLFDLMIEVSRDIGIFASAIGYGNDFYEVEVPLGDDRESLANYLRLIQGINVL